MGKDVLIKMDAKLYAEVKKAVKGYTVDYPSIKNFVEKAVQQQLQKKIIDIENIPAEAFRTKKLLREFVSPKSKFELCHLCGQVHLHSSYENQTRRWMKDAEKRVKQNKRDFSICSRCRELIDHYKNLQKPSPKSINRVDSSN